MIEVSSERSKSLFYMHTYCCRCWCSVLLLLFLFCYVETVCGFTTEYLDLLDINSDYTVRCCMTYVRVCICIYPPCTSATAAAALSCVSLLLLLQLLLLAAACCCCSSTCAGWQNLLPTGSLHLFPLFSFYSFKHDLFSMYPLAVVLCPTCSFDVLTTV